MQAVTGISLRPNLFFKDNPAWNFNNINLTKDAYNYAAIRNLQLHVTRNIYDLNQVHLFAFSSTVCSILFTSNKLTHTQDKHSPCLHTLTPSHHTHACKNTNTASRLIMVQAETVYSILHYMLFWIFLWCQPYSFDALIKGLSNPFDPALLVFQMRS